MSRVSERATLQDLSVPERAPHLFQVQEAASGHTDQVHNHSIISATVLVFHRCVRNYRCPVCKGGYDHKIRRDRFKESMITDGDVQIPCKFDSCPELASLDKIKDHERKCLRRPRDDDDDPMEEEEEEEEAVEESSPTALQISLDPNGIGNGERLTSNLVQDLPTIRAQLNLNVSVFKG